MAAWEIMHLCLTAKRWSYAVVCQIRDCVFPAVYAFLPNGYCIAYVCLLRTAILRVTRFAFEFFQSSFV